MRFSGFYCFVRSRFWFPQLLFAAVWVWILGLYGAAPWSGQVWFGCRRGALDHNRGTLLKGATRVKFGQAAVDRNKNFCCQGAVLNEAKRVECGQAIMDQGGGPVAQRRSLKGPKGLPRGKTSLYSRQTLYLIRVFAPL